MNRGGSGQRARVGTSWAFIGALAALLTWSASGPLFNFSEQWQLVINSVLAIIEAPAQIKK